MHPLRDAKSTRDGSLLIISLEDKQASYWELGDWSIEIEEFIANTRVTLREYRDLVAAIHKTPNPPGDRDTLALILL